MERGETETQRDREGIGKNKNTLGLSPDLVS
jgi:hypothetical protein